MVEGPGSLPDWPSARSRVKSAEKCIAYKAALRMRQKEKELETAEAETAEDAAKANKAAELSRAERSQWKAYKLRLPLTVCVCVFVCV